MIQLRYPNITGKTPEERQNQMERYVRSLVDQLNMKKTTQEPTQTQENIPQAPQPKIDFSKMFASYIAEYWKTIYPVGAIYLSVSAADPSTLFGGTWEQITDRFLLAAGSYYKAGATGGEANHTLTVAEMPEHNHSLNVRVKGYSGWHSYTTTWYEIVHDYLGGDYHGPGETLNVADIDGGTIGNKGNSQPHNNMPPYLAVYIWKRIA